MSCLLNIKIEPELPFYITTHNFLGHFLTTRRVVPGSTVSPRAA